MPDSDLLSRELTDEPRALSADELADFSMFVHIDTDAMTMPTEQVRRLLATIKWLQGERDAWEREAEAHDETIAARDARIDELQAEATRQAGVYERYLQEMVALYDAKLERARELYEEISIPAMPFSEYVALHKKRMVRYNAAIAAVKVASDE